MKQQVLRPIDLEVPGIVHILNPSTCHYWLDRGLLQVSIVDSRSNDAERTSIHENAYTQINSSCYYHEYWQDLSWGWYKVDKGSITAIPLAIAVEPGRSQTIETAVVTDQASLIAKVELLDNIYSWKLAAWQKTGERYDQPAKVLKETVTLKKQSDGSWKLNNANVTQDTFSILSKKVYLHLTELFPSELIIGWLYNHPFWQLAGSAFRSLTEPTARLPSLGEMLRKIYHLDLPPSQSVLGSISIQERELAETLTLVSQNAAIARFNNPSSPEVVEDAIFASVQLADSVSKTMNSCLDDTLSYWNNTFYAGLQGPFVAFQHEQYALAISENLRLGNMEEAERLYSQSQELISRIQPIMQVTSSNAQPDSWQQKILRNQEEIIKTLATLSLSATEPTSQASLKTFADRIVADNFIRFTQGIIPYLTDHEALDSGTSTLLLEPNADNFVIPSLEPEFFYHPGHAANQAFVEFVQKDLSNAFHEPQTLDGLFDWLSKLIKEYPQARPIYLGLGTYIRMFGTDAWQTQSLQEQISELRLKHFECLHRLASEHYVTHGFLPHIPDFIRALTKGLRAEPEYQIQLATAYTLFSQDILKNRKPLSLDEYLQNIADLTDKLVGKLVAPDVWFSTAVTQMELLQTAIQKSPPESVRDSCEAAFAQMSVPYFQQMLASHKKSHSKSRRFEYEY